MNKVIELKSVSKSASTEFVSNGDNIAKSILGNNAKELEADIDLLSDNRSPSESIEVKQFSENNFLQSNYNLVYFVIFIIFIVVFFIFLLKKYIKS